MTHLPNSAIILSTGTILLLVSIIFGWVLAPKFIHDTIADQVKLKNGSEVWDKWTNVPIPIYFNVYLFNVTNPVEIAKGELPKLTEVGPFVYRELREKIDIRVNDDNGTILYKERVTYFFETERSNGLSENDVLSILNVPYIAMSQKISELPYPLSYLATMFISKYKQKPFIQKTVGEILFKGWHLPIAEELEEYIGQQVIPNNTFGLFYGKNGTDDGFLEVDAGLSSVEDFGKVLSWRGIKKLQWWKEGSECNELKGTDGSIFPPFVTKKRVLRIFNADLCRSLYLTFEREISFLGIPTYRFSAPKEMLQDPRHSKDNRCYCNEEDVDDCLYSGVMELSICRQGAPVAMSTPHFLDGYAGYSEKSGLQPNREKHVTILDIEPTTGIVLRAHKRIQVNVLMKPVKDIQSLSKMPEMLFPVVWADESAEIDEELADQLKSQLLTPLMALDISKWVAMGVSLSLILCACILYMVSSRGDTNSEDSESGSSMMKKGTNAAVAESNQLKPTDKLSMPLIKT